MSTGTTRDVLTSPVVRVVLNTITTGDFNMSVLVGSVRSTGNRRDWYVRLLGVGVGSVKNKE